MRIEIDTNGFGSSTVILINGEIQHNLEEFNLSIKSSGGIKCQMVRGQKAGKKEFVSYYGADFQKNDELYGKGKEN